MSEALLIHDLSEQLDITPKAIRYYEKVGIIQPSRNSANYRVYSEKEIKKLEFVKKARTMNLSIDEIKTIINIRDEGNFPCGKVLALLQEKIAELDKMIKEMTEFRVHLAEQFEYFKGHRELGKQGEVCGFIESISGK
jgi:DNA-binding transcriptional MerR regulator